MKRGHLDALGNEVVERRAVGNLCAALMLVANQVRRPPQPPLF